MAEQSDSYPRLSKDPFFWFGIFLSPVLICIGFSMQKILNGDSVPVLLIGLVLVSLVGAFYSGFQLGWRCASRTGPRVVLGLVFTAGCLFLDFVFFFIGCCTLFSGL